MKFKQFVGGCETRRLMINGKFNGSEHFRCMTIVPRLSNHENVAIEATSKVKGYASIIDEVGNVY